ncbi:TetR family transcriptional regulator [Microcella frigidaquae]|uniref:AcrR family transcriptional regulator n=1 Tax=Microcella frigidaquae TaxID=424758 RepID=A0A840X8T7_9MICO|nr:TetR family transcriptional regulator [Microcella frigidaquae]MBB5617525.1 AcrR family transcriptional regulator [Microcella frigidaquae]NHN45394.1 helix-turn-helix transcriptional regulator [Microcella frigidaquae]
MRQPRTSSIKRFRNTRSQIGEPLVPRARQVLEAAQRVVDRDGADKLTLRAIAREAGEATSVVLYHFSTMDRLEALLLDSLWHDIDVEFLATIASLPDDAASRVDALVDFHASIAEDPQRYQRYFGLVSGVVRKPDTRVEIAEIYRGYRMELNVPLLAHPSRSSDETEALAALVLAVAEGLSFLQLMTADAASPTPGFELLRSLLRKKLARGREPSPGDFRAAAHDPGARPADAMPEPPAIHRTAQRLLDAGHVILRSNGLRGLSLESLARTSGEARPAVGYHFGSKLGFVEALAMDAVHRWVVAITAPEMWNRLVTDYDGRELARVLEPATMEVVQVFPVAQRRQDVRDVAFTAIAHARAAIADQLRSWTLDRGYPAEDAADIVLAAIAGLTLQKMYDPDGFDSAPALEQLGSLLS